MSIDAPAGFADDDRPEENLLENPEFLAKANRKSFLKRRKEAEKREKAAARELRGVVALIESWLRNNYVVKDNQRVTISHLFDRQYRAQIRNNDTNKIIESVFLTYFNHDNIKVGYSSEITLENSGGIEL
jgi:hypothetical protein